MAPKGVRGRPSSTAGPSAKRSKVVDHRFKEVTDVLESDEQYHLLAGMSTCALESPAEDRHPYQVAVVDMIGDAFAGMRAKIEAEIAALRTQIWDAPKNRAAREAAALEAGKVLEERKAALQNAEAFQHEVSAACDEAQGKLKGVLASQKQAEKLFAACVQERDNLVKLFNEGVLPKKEKAATKAECVALVKSLKAISLDASVLTALQVTLMKQPSERVGFDATVVENLVKELENKIAAAEAKLAEGEPARQERSSLAEAATTAHADALQRLNASYLATLEAKASKAEAEFALKAANKAVGGFIAELLQVAKTVDERVEELADFEKTHASFLELKDLKRPTPEPEEPQVPDFPVAEVGADADPGVREDAAEAVNEM